MGKTSATFDCDKSMWFTVRYAHKLVAKRKATSLALIQGATLLFFS
uniref:Uncharacterized protein n=1 Tax=Arundo donax TaxID=35708 RepID=A0A0A8ZIH9_ARUDO